MGPYTVPVLSPEALEARAKAARVDRILQMMRRASNGVDLWTWLTMSSDSLERKYAEAIEPLLRAAEEGEPSEGPPQPASVR